jgi:hypothetical protein
MLKNAIKNGLVIKDNFNEKKYDRTCWYALTDKAYKYFPELTTPHFLQVLNLTTSMNTDLVNFPNGFVKNPTPIPDTIPDTKKKTPIVPKGTILFNSFWDMYPTKKGKKKAFNIWKRAKLDTHADVIMEKLKIQIESDESWKSGYIPHPTTYLAGERWEDELTLPKPKTPAIQGSNPVVVTEKSPEIVFNTFFQDFLNLIKMKLIPSDAAQPTYKEWLHEGYGESATAYAKKHNLMQVVRVDRSV